MSESIASDDVSKYAPSERTPLLTQASSPTSTTPEISTGGSRHGLSSDRLTKQFPSKNGHTEANQSISYARGTLCTMALGFLVFLQATNISMLTTTYSQIAEELDAFDRVSWFTSAYLIAMSALGPLNGKLASMFGPRICIFASSAILAIGSTISGFANGFETFILGRCITGVGASGIFTVSIIVVLELTGSERRGLAIGLLNSGYTFGVAIGAASAGALLHPIGWRPLFWMQAPIALTGGFILFLAIPRDFSAGKKADPEQSTLQRLARLDYLGAAMLTMSIVLLLLPLSSPKKISLLPVGLSALVFLTFVLNEVYLAYDPIIPVTLLKSRGLLLTCLATLGYMMARWSVLFYTPTFALAVRQWTPGTAGAILIPTNAGFAIGGLLVGWLHIRRPGSFWVPTIVVYTLFPFTLILLSFLVTQHSPAWLFVLAVFLCGAITGAALNYNLAHLLHLTPRSTHYVAMSLLATFRGFAGSFGSAIGGGLFTRTLAQALETGFAEEGLPHEEDLVRRLLGSPALVEKLTGVRRDVAIHGYEQALRMLFLAGAALAGLMVIAQAGTGWTAAKEDEQELLRAEWAEDEEGVETSRENIERD